MRAVVPLLCAALLGCGGETTPQNTDPNLRLDLAGSDARDERDLASGDLGAGGDDLATAGDLANGADLATGGDLAGGADLTSTADLAQHPRTLAFGNAASYTVGKTPLDVAAGDLDGDGWPDVAVANSNGDSVSILINQKNGTLKAGTPLTARQPFGVVIADFDGDKRLDVAVTDYGYNPNGLFYSGYVHVFLGNGDGTFQAVKTSGTGGTGPSGLAVLDANGDARPDLVVADNDSSDVVLLTGKGDGTFNLPVHLGATLSPDQVAIADATGDNVPDAVVTTAGDVSIYPGDGKTLGKAQTVSMSGIYGRALAANLDGNSYPDLVVAVPPGGLDVRYGGANGFAAAQVYTCSGPSDVALADFDTDGKLDAVTGTNGASAVQVLPGFGTARSFSTGKSPAKLIAADLDRDGLPDVVTANQGDDTVSVLLNVSK